MSEADAGAVIHNLYGTLDYADIADADWVIEAATENLPLKRKIFAQIEGVVRPTR
jgi:enoyl-CoA hydratase/3-hydroxyacyl-CoA dehydrogenase